MAKKEKWQPETAALNNNPFAALSGLKKSDSADASQPETTKALEKKQPEACSEPKLPKVKSTNLERAHHGGKTVTVIHFHGEPSDEDKLAWLKSMKKVLGVGGTIEDGVVMLQGDQRERV